MGDQIGQTKLRTRSDLVTWEDARDFIDFRCYELRQRAFNMWASDPCQLAIFLQVLSRKWTAAAFDLKKLLLGRKRKSPQYQLTRTLAPKSSGRNKTLARRSSVNRRRKHFRRTDEDWKRSHHKGSYTPNQPTRGRPKVSASHRKATKRRAELKRLSKEHDATSKARIASGLKPYSRLSATARHAREQRRREHTQRIQSARATIRLLNFGHRFKDRRSNHDVRYAYLPPMPRQRSKPGGRKHYHRAAGATGRKNATTLLAIRAALATATRSAHLRGYWREVHHLAARH